MVHKLHIYSRGGLGQPDTSFKIHIKAIRLLHTCA